MTPEKTIVVMALTMLTASANATWEYKDVADKMGEHGVEHHASISSVEKNQAMLMLASTDSGTSILIATTGVMNGETVGGKLWAAQVDIRFDSGPIWSYKVQGLNDNFRQGFIERVQVSGNWEKIDAQAFIAALRSAQVVHVRAPIYGEGETVFTFNVAGLKWP